MMTDFPTTTSDPVLPARVQTTSQNPPKTQELPPDLFGEPVLESEDDNWSYTPGSEVRKSSYPLC